MIASAHYTTITFTASSEITRFAHVRAKETSSSHSEYVRCKLLNCWARNCDV